MKRFCIPNLLLLLFCISVSAAQDGVGVSLRASINLNGSWQYVVNQSQSSIPQTGWAPARIPAAPYVDNNVADTWSIWYQRSILIRSAWVTPGRRFFVKLEKCGHYCAVYLNRHFVGDHYGQFTPLEVEVTPYVLAGIENEVQVYSHDADSTYARRGAVIDQSTCPKTNPNCFALSYRPAALNSNERNWVGLVGDVSLSWTPEQYVASTQVITSVRNKTITANLNLNSEPITANVKLTALADVLDAGKEVVQLPLQPIVNGAAALSVPWTSPILWGPAPYGQPHLYELRVTLMRNGAIIDVSYIRFGFRETWVQGKTLMLNGQPLWMTTSFLYALAPLRTANDRRTQAFQNWIQEQSGQNSAMFHWDDAGLPAYDLSDEQGILTFGVFYCNGINSPEIAFVDNKAAWTAEMGRIATEWAQANQNHPSIIILRPIDVLPAGAGDRSPVDLALEQAIHSVDQTRPIADNSDVDTWAQDIKSSSTTCDNGSAFAAKLAGETKPLLVRELYGLGLPCTAQFFTTLYQIAYTGGAAGMFEQELDWYTYAVFTPEWPSQSGVGNRPTSSFGLPDWISRTWMPSSWSGQFADMYTNYTGLAVPAFSPTSGDYQASAVIGETAFLVPPDGTGEPVGVTAAGDASAWFVTPFVGSAILTYSGSGGDVKDNVIVNAPPAF